MGELTGQPNDQRIAGVDVARGVALLGMMSVHILPRVTEDGGRSAAYLISAGRAAALFAVLAGVGIALMSGGPVPPSGRRAANISVRLAVRAVLIGTLGLALGALSPPVYVILAYYAVLFLVAIPFLRLRPWPLGVLALAWIVIAPAVSHRLRDDYGPPPGQPDFAALSDPVGLLERIVLTGVYPVLPWVAYLLVGLTIGRLPLRSPRFGWSLLLGGGSIAIASMLGARWWLDHGGIDRLIGEPPEVVLPDATTNQVLNLDFYGTTPTDSLWWMLVPAPHSSTPADLLQTSGTACAVLGAALLLCRSQVGRVALTPLGAAGSMTLTLYTLHVLALYEEWGPVNERGLLYASHVVALLLIATAWRAFFKRGPIEETVHRCAAAVADWTVPASKDAGDRLSPRRDVASGTSAGTAPDR
ncbi:MAG: heparan-alpha-glucosaminide N-acetyltransferase domain-containing protein [Candidatus Nanopelagicales bacterium]